MRITLVAGARPNFMKIAPIIKAIKKANDTGKNISFRLIHTGQHYDYKMSGSFFEELGIPIPDANLESGGGTQAEQTAAIMIGFEKELLNNKTDVVLVVGDVNSTMACSITAKKMCVGVVHVEAGIRSGDLSMPEEINRMVTDSISDHFFTTSENANDNLIKSGFTRDRIHLVGNTMIDTLLENMPRLKNPQLQFRGKSIENGCYFILTLHRPANVDNSKQLQAFIDAVIEGVGEFPVIFPVHPRTAKILQFHKIHHEGLIVIEPLSYLEFNYLVNFSKGVITDSGGITEETTVMGIPCITLRDNTERPETITTGTNELAGTNPKNLQPYLSKIITGNWKKGSIPPFWDGHAAERIIDTLCTLYS